jgi:hypothetical protein
MKTSKFQAPRSREIPMTHHQPQRTLRRGSITDPGTFQLGAALVIGCWLLMLPFAFAQGSLTPPGPPAPTMKSLDQIEPRIPISAPTNITQSGSYYLTTNLEVASGSGLQISAADVTVDLNGFTLRSLTAGAGHGILAGAASTNLWIRNGTLRDWATGISAAVCVGGRFERLHLVNNQDMGLLSGAAAQVWDCVVVGASNSIGIIVSSGSRVKDCTVRGVNLGISVGQGGILTGCAVRDCHDTGISAGTHSLITECSVSGGSNGIVANVALISRCTVGGQSGVGIDAGNVSTVVDCIVQNTLGNGIQGASGNVIRRNTLSNIGVSTNPAAIHLSSIGNRLEANQVTFSPAHGLRVVGGANMIIHNFVQGTGGNYSEIASGNLMGPVAHPENATNAWSNF